MTEINEYASDVQSKPYTIEDWHREYDGTFANIDSKHYDKEAEIEAWKKWYSLPENDIKKDIPTYKKLSETFSKCDEIIVKLKRMLGETDENI